MERIRTLSRPHGRPRVRSGKSVTTKKQRSGASLLATIDEPAFTRTDPRPAVRPAEGPNSFHWKNVKLKVLSCCTKFHEPHVVSEYAHFQNNIIAMKALPSDIPIINI